jgi:cyclase
MKRGQIVGLRMTSMAALTAALALSGIAAESPIRISRLGDKAAVFQIGTTSTTNVLALASRRGLVVVDTGILPSQGAALRAAVEREFGRKDFAYVVNTHSHYDHTDGNQAFADVPIVAHSNAVREMSRMVGSPAAREAFIRSRADYLTALQGELKTAVSGSRDEGRIREQLAESAALMDDFQKGRLVLTPPTILFNDRLTIDLGDLTLNLVCFGPAHTASDIFVHVPELRLLATGDVFHKEWLPQIEGAVDPARWLRVLASLPAGSEGTETVIPGHDAFLSGDELRAREAYLKSVWDGVASARREGLTLASAKAGLPFDDKNPLLAGLIRQEQGRDLHLANIEAAWRLQSESASQTPLRKTALAPDAQVRKEEK